MFFFFNDTATTEIYTLSLHDALPISGRAQVTVRYRPDAVDVEVLDDGAGGDGARALPGVRERVGLYGGELLRSGEHTSEIQSRQYLVCRLLLEKKKKGTISTN